MGEDVPQCESSAAFHKLTMTSASTPGIARMSDHARADADRTWTGNDDSARNHHGVIPLAASPVILSLSWKASAGSPPRPVGTFRLDLHRLLADGLIRLEAPDSVRVRFVHEPEGSIYLQVNQQGPRVFVGEIHHPQQPHP